jgi:hypothetical protein
VSFNGDVRIRGMTAGAVGEQARLTQWLELCASGDAVPPYLRHTSTSVLKVNFVLSSCLFLLPLRQLSIL